ncbi:tetratricopeptide repeat protein [Catenulispora subtropica]|uniref:Tetratricopeptide repeat protein n=1 Tax=Catenulispora subtropica TaxID=450798 RepID=A0ABP5BY42_9ACTN
MASTPPDPARAGDVAEFTVLLNELRVWAGNPSYRALAKKAGAVMRPPQNVSQSTLAEAFQPWRRRLSLDLVVAIVRALGLEEADVARWRAACVRVHAVAKSGGPVGVLRQLPAHLATFTGRDAELARLWDAVTAHDGDTAPTVVISAIEGMGGVGKTQLAVRVAHMLVQEGRYADLQLFVNLRGFDAEREPTDPSEVLDAFLRALEVPAQQIPAGLDERAAMFRDRVHGRHAVIVLDNAADEDQIRDLVPASPTCLVLVTSRRSLIGLEHADLHVLDVFTPAEGVALLRRVAGADRVDAEPEAAAAIVEACGRLPLAVALAASRLRSRPAWTLEHLESRLRAGGATALGAGDRGPRAVFDLSLQGLDPPERRLFTLLGLFPGPDFTAESAAALAGLAVAEAGRLLEELLDEHLLEQRTMDRFEFHDLLRAHAAERAAADLADGERDEAVHQLMTWYMLTMDAAGKAMKPGRAIPEYRGPEPRLKALAFASPAQAAEWCEQELTNLVAVTDHAAETGRPELGWRLPLTVSTYLGVRANWREWERLHLRALDCARATGNTRVQMKTLSGLGISAERLNDLEGAERYLDETLALARELGDRTSEAKILTILIATYSRTDRAQQGLAAADRAIAIGRELGDPYVERAALQNSSSCLLILKRPAEARDRLLEALELYQDPGDELTRGLVLGNIAFTEVALGRYEEAEAAYREYLRLSRNSQDQHGQTEALRGIASVRRAAGRMDEARSLYAEALVLLDRMGSPEAAKVRERLATPDLTHASDDELSTY